jgi:hypothetical protein
MTQWPSANDADDPWDGGLPGGGLPGGGNPPPGQEHEKTKRWAEVKWTYSEPEPKGACTGFDVAIFAGASFAEAVALAVPIERIDDPSARRWICPIELPFPVALRAAVRACYGQFNSKWANAAVAAQFSTTSRPTLERV